MLMNWCSTVLSLVFLQFFFQQQSYVSVLADQGYYADSEAAFIGDSNVNLLNPPMVENVVVTSPLLHSGTVDPLYVTYMGAFSNSGPHLLGEGVFTRGSTVTNRIQLDRHIGDLVRVLLHSNNTDGWLLSDMSIRIRDVRYVMQYADPALRASKQWLEMFDPESFAQLGNGYSPEAQDTSIPSSSRLELTVSEQIRLYTVTGKPDAELPP